jgi:hypothetical protein
MKLIMEVVLSNELRESRPPPQNGNWPERLAAIGMPHGAFRVLLRRTDTPYTRGNPRNDGALGCGPRRPLGALQGGAAELSGPRKNCTSL